MTGACGGAGAGVGKTGAGFGATGAAATTGTGAGATGLGGTAGDGCTTAAATWAAVFSLVPKTPVISGGTSICFCPERRVSNAGFIAARIFGKGRSTSVSPRLASLGKVPAGAASRSWANRIRTAPEGNWASAVWTGSEKEPVTEAEGSGARFAGNFTTISLRRTWMVSPEATCED